MKKRQPKARKLRKKERLKMNNVKDINSGNLQKLSNEQLQKMQASQTPKPPTLEQQLQINEQKLRQLDQLINEQRNNYLQKMTNVAVSTAINILAQNFLDPTVSIPSVLEASFQFAKECDLACEPFQEELKNMFKVPKEITEAQAQIKEEQEVMIKAIQDKILQSAAPVSKQNSEETPLAQ